MNMNPSGLVQKMLHRDSGGDKDRLIGKEGGTSLETRERSLISSAMRLLAA